jgi:hypothetical protein
MLTSNGTPCRITTCTRINVLVVIPNLASTFLASSLRAGRRLKAEGVKVAAIARVCSLSRPTIYSILVS